jgi:hypothetical protein
MHCRFFRFGNFNVRKIFHFGPTYDLPLYAFFSGKLKRPRSYVSTRSMKYITTHPPQMTLVSNILQLILLLPLPFALCPLACFPPELI